MLPVPVDYVAKAEAERQRLLMTAQDITSGWATDLALGILSDEEKRKTESLAYLRKGIAGDGFQYNCRQTAYDNIGWPEQPQNT